MIPALKRHQRSIFVIVCVLVLLSISVISYVERATLPPITHFQLANSNFVTGSIVEVSFDYQPGNTSGYILVQFSNEGKVVDTRKLDTKNMKSGVQTISSTAFVAIPSAFGTVSLSWCPYYVCSLAEKTGEIEFTIVDAVTNPDLANEGMIEDGTLSITFYYQPVHTPGYIEVQFSKGGSIVDTQQLDTKDMIQRVYMVSSASFSDTSGEGSVAFLWCPHYDCSHAQQMGSPLKFQFGPLIPGLTPTAP